MNKKITETLSNPNIESPTRKRQQQQNQNKKNEQGFKNTENVLLIGCRLANSTSNLNKISRDPTLFQNHIVVQSKINSLTNATTSTITTTKTTTIPTPSTPTSGKDDAQMVDFASSIIFPLLFILFNIVYWTFYLNMDILSSN